jgi:hypothetical protein
MAIAFAIINQEIAGSIALVDINEDKLDGEVKDLRQGSAFHQRVRIEASSDYNVSAGSHLIIVTAGGAQKPGMSRLSLIEMNGTLIFDLFIVALVLSVASQYTQADHLHLCYQFSSNHEVHHSRTAQVQYRITHFYCLKSV